MTGRDPRLEALWREASREEPPAQLDDAIRAAAHRAVQSKPTPAGAPSPRSRAPWPAWAPFAAAASIGAIAIAVWQVVPQDLDETRVVASDTPRRAEVAEVAKPETRAVVPSTVQAPPAAPSTAQVRPASPMAPTPTAKARADAREEAFVAPPPAAEAASTSAAGGAPATGGAPDARDKRAEPQVTAADALANVPKAAVAAASAPPAAPAGNAAPALARERANGTLMAQRAAPPQSAAAPQPAPPHSAASPQPPAPQSVDAFIAAIDQARAEHRDVEAEALLQAMRARYPDADARLPTRLRDWASRIPVR